MQEYLNSKWRQAVLTICVCHIAFATGMNIGLAIVDHWVHLILAVVFGVYSVLMAILYGCEFERYRLNK